MSQEWIWRFGCALVLAVGLASSVYFRSHNEATLVWCDNSVRFRPIITPFLLPVFLLSVFILFPVFFGFQVSKQIMLSVGFGVLLHILVYYLLLIPVQPLLRKRISPRTMVVLWLLPNFLYLAPQRLFMLSEPLWILRVPEKIVQFGFALWAVGFCAVLAWNVISHLRFRHSILKGSQPVADQEILSLWRQEACAAGFKNTHYHIVRSPGARSPLSIGLIRRTIFVVLPEQEYSMDELALIFRHEIAHIGRQDGMSKFFLTFCTALCWFNPLMWLAMRRCAEDMELSCDEAVLLRADSDERRRYADLLLHSAGDHRGFTTSLSASAESMRYRLKNIMTPVKRHAGGIIAGIVIFALFISFGCLSLSISEGTGKDFLFPQGEDQYTLRPGSGKECTDEAALIEYLADLQFCQITGTYMFSRTDQSFDLLIKGTDGTVYMLITDQYMELVQLEDSLQIASYYHCTDPIDFAYLNSLIREEAA